MRKGKREARYGRLLLASRFIYSAYTAHTVGKGWKTQRRSKAKVIDEEVLCREGSLTQTTKGENAGAVRKHKRNGAEEKDLTVVSRV